MNPSRTPEPRGPGRADSLPEALRELAAASPEASPELGSKLSSAFARHHVQRRRRRAAVVLALAACLAVLGYWFGPHREPVIVKVARPSSPEPESAQKKDVAPESPKPVAPSVARTTAKPRMHAKREAQPQSQAVEAPAATVEASDFVALPTFDPAIPVGESHMVRMDLPGSELQLMGYPVEGQFLDRRIVTDVLVGQDGMPYAVRLVPTRNVH